LTKSEFCELFHHFQITIIKAFYSGMLGHLAKDSSFEYFLGKRLVAGLLERQVLMTIWTIRWIIPGCFPGPRCEISFGVPPIPQRSLRKCHSAARAACALPSLQQTGSKIPWWTI